MSSVKKWTYLKYSWEQPGRQNNWTGWDHTGLFDDNQALLRHLCLRDFKGRDVGVRLKPCTSLLDLHLKGKLIKDHAASVVWVHARILYVCVPNCFSGCACYQEKCLQMLLLHPPNRRTQWEDSRYLWDFTEESSLEKARCTVSESRPKLTVSSLTGFSFLLVAPWCVDVKEHLRSLSYVV